MIAVSYLLILVVTIFSDSALSVESSKTSLVKWTGGNNFEWSCPATKNMCQNYGKFISRNAIATRSAIYKNVAFLALPRYIEKIIHSF